MLVFNRYRKRNLNRGESLEVDEIFFDRHQLSGKDLKWENRLEKPISFFKLRFLFLILAAILIFFWSKNIYLAVFKGSFYAAKATANYTKEIWERSPRGIIYDSKGTPLVKNISSFNLVAIPAELPRDRQSQEDIINALADLLKTSREDIVAAFDKIDRFSFRPVLVLEDLSHEELLAFKSRMEELKGLRLEENFKRDYGDAGVYSHVLGYTGRVSASDVKKNQNFLLTDIIGKNGLEVQYEQVLRGEHGVTRLEAKAWGGAARVAGTTKAQPGRNLVLFLDGDLQTKLTEITSSHLAGLGLTKATAVAVDPASGGILALQSWPLFDSNAFSSRLSAENYERIFKDKNQPLFNRVVSGLYPPGSTVKPFLGIAALQEKTIDEKTTVNDTGSIVVAGQEFRGWKPLGVVDLYKAIALSSNIFFYSVGGGYGNIEGLGPLRIHDYMERFGFGLLSSIDLPQEAAGLIPTPEWKKEAKKESWFVGDTYNMSIGQGFVQVTPLQLAMATAAIANGGTLLKPRVVKSITDERGNIIASIAPEILRKNFVDSQALQTVRNAMHGTILISSGRSLASLPGSAGGKTGTAQTGVGENTDAWFTVFAPYDNPKIVLTIMVEDAGAGSLVAVPIARDVLEWYLSER